MKVDYNYASQSMCINDGENTTLGLSSDLSRKEGVSFNGKVKRPLIFRDAMLMLRDIVISDTRVQKKERVEFFRWLDGEINRRMMEKEKVLVGIREEVMSEVGETNDLLDKNLKEIERLEIMRSEIKKELDSRDSWKDYYKLEREFWKFIRERDYALWFVLDPVITVHPDQVSFEAFSLDESTYGCLSVDMDEFEMLKEPKLGTTNIDFSAKLAVEMERFRTYSKVELAVEPEGFTVDTGIMPEYLEKKIDLPESWIKGFNQVSSAASLNGIELTLSKVDMYDICSFMRRHKARKSPRYMKWFFEPGERVKIVFEPFKKELELSCIYEGKKRREEKIWGRRRWLVMEKILPLAQSFNLKILGFGMPQFITANLGGMKMTIGFSSWSSNDWVKGTAFNILGGYIGKGEYEKVYELLEKERRLTLEEIYDKLKECSKKDILAGVGTLYKKGEAYFDPVKNVVRFRRLCSHPIPEELYETSEIEIKVKEHIDEGLNGLTIERNKDGFRGDIQYKIPNEKYRNWRFRETEDYEREFDESNTFMIIDEEGQIAKVGCDCKGFQKGPRNISAPCEHILALYSSAIKFQKLELEPDKKYKMNDIMELLI